MYADRGEYFTELSASAGLGISGPFSVTTQEPFTVPVNATCPNNSASSPAINCLSKGPFAPVTPPPTNLKGVAQNLIFNMSGLSGCPEPVTPTCTPNGFPNFDFLFGGYDPANKLPYSENWSFDLQWQPKNDVVLTMGYIGNHGVHQPIPIPFNQPGIATPSHPINGQIYSYGFQAAAFSSNPNVPPDPSSPSKCKQRSERFQVPTEIRLCVHLSLASIPMRISGEPKEFPPTTRCSCRRRKECLTD